jgi:hypothetical protein
MTGELSGTGEVCKTEHSGSIPALVSKLRALISRWKMRKFIKYPAWKHLKDLPDNLTILRSGNPDWLAGLVAREYYWPVSRYNGYESLRAANMLKMLLKEEREKNIALSKENSRLKRKRPD